MRHGLKTPVPQSKRGRLPESYDLTQTILRSGLRRDGVAPLLGQDFLWRLAIAEGFYKRDDMPAIVDRDGGLQGRLTLAGDTITDGFE